jgi:SAM-dependent methyltransferase
MDQEKHWNKIGAGYDDEIFDVFQSDRLKKLPLLFEKHADSTRTAIDFGCGTGKALQYLSPAFREVIAVDISTELLNIARGREYKNVTFRQVDLTRRFKMPPADFGFCCNVVMLPDQARNEVMFKNIRKSIKAGGSAVFVLPSLDSFFYSALRMMEWYRREGVDVPDIIESEFDGFRGARRDIIRGIVSIDGVKTKHYSLPELELILPQSGFTINSIERLEYDWNTEFSKPPSWMKSPYPWDWVVDLGVT